MTKGQVVQRCHSMPFSASPQQGEGVGFRLWAPGAKRVSLCLLHGVEELILPMQKDEKGWYSYFASQAGPSTLYSFIINDGQRVPDPASRFQPHDVHGMSQVIDPASYRWQDDQWRGRPWEEAVIYELHVGTFTPEGSFEAIIPRLDYLADLGVTAIELMPVADFPGRYNWGYDGVLPFAPDSSYGTPDQLKKLIDAAHNKGLMVILDVVYNHFGPEGNYLHVYAPAFFTDRHSTPWGAGLNFDGDGNRVVRDFFIHNALYWLEEYHLDGLRLDAVHAIYDDADPHILIEIAEKVAENFGEQRHIHLILENDNNTAHYLQRVPEQKPRWYTSQWNDDIHHALHVITTGETEGYYADYAASPTQHLARCLTEGFAYQGEPSPYREGECRGERSEHLPITAFVSFLQNHDQIGNRAFGERITAIAPETAIKAVNAIFLIAPSPPMLFMGQEWAAPQPFPFFCDFGPDLAQAVVQGRRSEFAKFPKFQDPAAREAIPDPGAINTFRSAVLDWSCLDQQAAINELRFHKELLHLRHEHVVPLLKENNKPKGIYELFGKAGVYVSWRFAKDVELCLIANLSNEEARGAPAVTGQFFYSSHPALPDLLWGRQLMLPWSLGWFLLKN